VGAQNAQNRTASIVIGIEPTPAQIGGAGAPSDSASRRAG
jgi:hypothetical protein